MPSVQDFCSSKILKILIGCIDLNPLVSTFEITSPLLQWSHSSEQFLIMDVIIELCSIHLTGLIYDGVYSSINTFRQFTTNRKINLIGFKLQFKVSVQNSLKLKPWQPGPRSVGISKQTHEITHIDHYS